MSELPPPVDAGTLTGPYAPPSLPPALANGLRLALAAEDAGPGLARWLGEHPELAAELARFLAAQRDLQAVLDPGPTAEPAGTTVGGYELREEIGRGGMGVVYRAYDPVLRREVALKRVLAGPLVTADDLAKFRFEAEASASLDHPNIVPVFGVREAGGAPFLVMPLMAGGSLAGWLKALGPDRRQPPKEAARMIRDIARAVHHAHQRGLLHRDLKPANILRDAEGRPHVADFGLARRLDVTMTAGPAGTAAYMAPEQARGDRVLTTAVDVHALGAILYELLAGAPPFGTGESASVLRRVAEEPAPPVRRVRPDVPKDLETVCGRCLEKQPEDRHATAGELADDLDRFLNGEPVGPRPGRVGAFGRLIARERTALPISNYAGHLWGAGWTFLMQGVIVWAALVGAGRWWLLALWLAYLTGWAGLFTAYIWARAGRLNSAERVSGLIKFWAVAAIPCLLPGRWTAAGPDVLATYQPLTVVIGFCILAHGPVHGGREFLSGLGVLAGAVLMPLLPETYWPAVHGAAWGGWALWYGLRMRAGARADAPPLPP